MSIPVWPAINFLANQGTGTLTLSDGRSKVTTSLDSGQDRIRRRFTRTISPYALTVRMDYNEVSLFKYFYDKVLFDGSLWFYMPVQDGRDYVVNLVRFDPAANPAINEIGYDASDVALSLQVRELIQINSQTYDYFARLGVLLGTKVIREVNRFVNVNYPNITAELS